MPPWQPRPQDLPQEIAVFPLPGVMLLPGGRLPLNIFEPRYLAMVEDALATGRMFGMIQPDPTGTAGPTGPALYRVGCLGRISYFSETEDGRFLIALTGLIRFAVGEELEMRSGYRRIRADYDAFPDDLQPAAAPAIDREALVSAARGYLARRSVEANWDALRNLPERTLAVTLAMSCPFAPAEKQAILEAGDETARAAALLALLRMGAVSDEQSEHPVS